MAHVPVRSTARGASTGTSPVQHPDRLTRRAGAAGSQLPGQGRPRYGGPGSGQAAVRTRGRARPPYVRCSPCPVMLCLSMSSSESSGARIASMPANRSQFVSTFESKTTPRHGGPGPPGGSANMRQSEAAMSGDAEHPRMLRLRVSSPVSARGVLVIQTNGKHFYSFLGPHIYSCGVLARQQPPPGPARGGGGGRFGAAGSLSGAARPATWPLMRRQAGELPQEQPL